jgi:hypothetical protein
MSAERNLSVSFLDVATSGSGLLRALEKRIAAKLRLSQCISPQVVFCLTCSQTSEITTEPSPTAEATRFTDPARTSPTAKMPG